MRGVGSLAINRKEENVKGEELRCVTRSKQTNKSSHFHRKEKHTKKEKSAVKNKTKQNKTDTLHSLLPTPTETHQNCKQKIQNHFQVPSSVGI
mmetsp:Transcript_36726/g.42914  ORF Transcript_36726/g.42914 Transcript_36726/m.42914 type:complete len:93 (+) Transcript_36726:457-735(+)